MLALSQQFPAEQNQRGNPGPEWHLDGNADPNTQSQHAAPLS
jgi:hypothetical protein